jgi:hypothetical protein
MNFEISNTIAMNRFEMLGPNELNVLIVELNLNKIAAARTEKLIPEQPDASKMVALNAPKRAILQARKHFKKNFPSPWSAKSAKKLATYLRHFTGLWAKRYSEIAKSGKPVPNIDLEKELWEAEMPGIQTLVESATDAKANVELGGAAGQSQTRGDLETLNLDCFAQVLRDLDYHFERKGKSIHFGLRCGYFLALIYVSAAPAGVMLTSRLPLLISQKRRLAVSSGIHFVNWKIAVGNFELQEHTGIVDFRMTLPLSVIPCKQQLSELLSGTEFILRYYAPGLMQIALGNEDPHTIMNRCAAEAENDCKKEKEQ